MSFLLILVLIFLGILIFSGIAIAILKSLDSSRLAQQMRENENSRLRLERERAEGNNGGWQGRQIGQTPEGVPDVFKNIR